MKIKLDNISVTLESQPVLKDINATIMPGEIVGLIGPNGAGKSTLLSLIAGLITPDSGTLFYDDTPAAAFPRKHLARKLAYLAQSTPIEWPLKSRQIVALGRLPHIGFFGPRDRQADMDAINRAMTAAEINLFAERSLQSLSGGEQMRVMLARALAVEADVLLADEPVTALDPAHQLHVMELLRRTSHKGGSVVVVLHDLTLASRFCDRLLLLDQGHLVAQGTPDTVLTQAQIATTYGITSLVGRHENETFILPWRLNPPSRPR